jgi:tRNA modification GTPase
MTQVVRQAAQGRALNDGLQVAIAGLPNAGKSSLLNRLAGADTAIVTEVPGTTRDTIRETISLDGVALTLVDMAGLRATDDRIESEGIRRAQAEIESADHVLWVADIQHGLDSAQADARRTLAADKPFSIVLNKIDLLEGQARQFDDDCPVFALSAKSGDGIDALRTHLKSLTGFDDTGAGNFSARRRHLQALELAAQNIAAAGSLFSDGLELAAEELKTAQMHLDELTGAHTSDDLLGEIFSSFCIGK